jgi:hypothetical protein
MTEVIDRIALRRFNRGVLNPGPLREHSLTGAMCNNVAQEGGVGPHQKLRDFST